MKKNTEIVQLAKPYQSTIEFEKFLNKNNVLNSNTKNVLDIGCGIGANIRFFSNKFLKKNFTGWDYSKSQITKAKKFNNNKNNKIFHSRYF